jgi:peptidyl-prolyl cis-trans isomerase B (cyclophilin B)
MTKRSLIIHSAWLLLGGFVTAHAQNAQNAPAAEAPAAPAPVPAPPAAPVKEVAVMKTNKGEMTIEFWEDVAPKTVANFKKLAKEGFYNGTAFHRIIKGFMIQGGDPHTKDPSKEGIYGTGDPGYKIKAEFNDRKHERGVLSMARSMDPDSAGSQFFICLDPAPFLDRQYTGFGRLVKGEDVLLKIGDTPVASNGRERSKPTERITVESVKIIPAVEHGAPAAPAPAAPIPAGK